MTSSGDSFAQAKPAWVCAVGRPGNVVTLPRPRTHVPGADWHSRRPGYEGSTPSCRTIRRRRPPLSHLTEESVIAENPVLMRLKELETMKDIADKIDEVKLVVGLDGLKGFLPLTGGKDH